MTLLPYFLCKLEFNRLNIAIIQNTINRRIGQKAFLKVGARGTIILMAIAAL